MNLNTPSTATAEGTMAPREWRLPGRAAWLLALVMAIALAAMRAAGTLGAPQLRPLLPLGFVLMALSPWVLMHGPGRRAIGLRRPASALAWTHLGAMGLGGAAALACVVIGLVLFGTGSDNWFVSIAANFARSVNLGLPVWQLALMFTITAMSFSPIGEEIFFRGLLQHALAQRFTARVGTGVECIGFGLVHLCHHGVVMGASGLAMQPRSAPIWFGLMVAVAGLFAWLRERSGSLYPAIAAHAAYNLVMSICIFMLLWPVGAGR